MAAARRRGCSPDDCAAWSNIALISGLTNRRSYMRVVIARPCWTSTGAVAFTMAMLSGDSDLVMGGPLMQRSTRAGGQIAAAGRPPYSAEIGRDLTPQPPLRRDCRH